MSSRDAKRVWEEEAKDETAETGKATHEYEQPEPSRPATYTAHVENTICEKFGRSLTTLVAKVEYHDYFGCLFSRIPGRYGPQTARNKARLGQAKEKTSCNKGCIVLFF